MKLKNHWISYSLLTALSVLLWLGLWLGGALEGLEHEALRWSYLVRGEQSSDDPVVYIDLDAYAISQIGDKPWDRLNFAQVVHALLGPGQARVVGVDLIFSIFGAGSLLDVDKARKGDYHFGQVVESFGERLILGAAYTGTTSATAELPLLRDGYTDPSEVPFPEAPTYPIIKYNYGRLGLVNLDEALNRSAIPRTLMAFVETQGTAFSRHIIDGKMRHFTTILKDARVEENEDEFRVVDSDGFGPPGVPKFSRRLLATLGLEVFLAAHGLNTDAIEYDTCELRILKDGAVFRRVPLVGEQSIEVNWLEGWGALPETKHYSFGEILNRANRLGQAALNADAAKVAELESWFARFKDKVIFLGPVDPTLKDIAPTPYNRIPVPKVSLHANLYRTLVEEAYIVKAHKSLSILLVIVLTLIVTSLALWGGTGRRLTRLGSLILLLIYPAIVFFVFSVFHLILPLIAPLGSSMTAILFVFLLKLGSEERQRRRIKKIFGAYLSPQLVEEMADAQRDPELGGIEAEITVLFSDVEGFTSLSENLPPNELVALMNEYFGAMTDVIHKEGGTLDKYIGDAIMTMFGMPMPVADHAARACLAAVHMQDRHASLCREWVQSGRWPEAVHSMRTRIGLNTGFAVIGNIGSEVRFNYTMMGDSVNLGARCESVAKAYGVYIIVTANTLLAALKDGCPLNYRMLDRVIVKGKSEPVELYELWDSGVSEAASVKCRDLYESGLKLYYSGEWKAARDYFNQSAEWEPGQAYAPTSPSIVLANRCTAFIESGGPQDWSGAYHLPTK